ncbi:hypothetical protein V9T40_010043 [Parthenolecanium corni]|uniref:gamma-glutamylcyclotransferase n=1 Tax=Parthenolecanium corni TaxID=536013 RepID=A0AAN9TK48_9HEMI
MSSVFLYFAYGSNLFAERIHANNPTAIRKGIGKLNGYRLDFGYHSKKWNGSVATIVPDPDSHVWGAVWEVDITDIPNLDRQEGVGSKIYDVVYVSPEMPSKGTVTCRCYQLCDLPPKITDGAVPENRKPSLLYLSIILRGAEQSQLPNYYIQQLQKIQHNGWDDKSNIGTQKFMLED